VSRSPVPALCLQVLAADPVRTQPYTTTEVQQEVAKLGLSVTRDTIARHLRNLADNVHNRRPLVDCYVGVVTIEHAWRLSMEGWRQRAEATDPAFADLIESSSLGTPEARRYRDTTPAEVRKQILDGLRDGEVGERG
jgi:hypothetical protein